MNVVVWYKEKESHIDKFLEFLELENVHKAEFKNATNIVVNCNCLTVYIGGKTIHIPFDNMEKFKVEV